MNKLKTYKINRTTLYDFNNFYLLDNGSLSVYFDSRKMY